MPTLYTVDASVFVNAYNVYEEGHADSLRFVDWLQNSGEPMLAPSLLLPEVAASISRVYRDAAMALEFADSLRALTHLTLIPVNDTVAWQATEIAAKYRLRGSDAVYVAVARRYGATLVTLDREQRERAAAVVETLSPAEAVAALSPPADGDG